MSRLLINRSKHIPKNLNRPPNTKKFIIDIISHIPRGNSNTFDHHTDFSAYNIQNGERRVYSTLDGMLAVLAVKARIFRV